MNRVISFSLWGSDPKYTVGAIKNAELAKIIYPEWHCIFYVNTISVPNSIIQELKSIPETTVIEKIDNDSWTNMFWRLEVFRDDSIDVCVFRDTDSRLNHREKSAVDAWLQSDKTFHIMRDHPHHGFPILGGMWGYKKNSQYNLTKLLDSFKPANRYGTDYEFFANLLYPLIGEDKIVHDEFFDKIPFPEPRNGTEFVGDVFDEHNRRHREYQKYI
jgi:protein O-GlcNAc transferase